MENLKALRDQLMSKHQKLVPKIIKHKWFRSHWMNILYSYSYMKPLLILSLASGMECLSRLPECTWIWLDKSITASFCRVGSAKWFWLLCVSNLDFIWKHEFVLKLILLRDGSSFDLKQPMRFCYKNDFETFLFENLEIIQISYQNFIQK